VPMVLKTGVTVAESEARTTHSMSLVLAEALFVWIALDVGAGCSGFNRERHRLWATRFVLQPWALVAGRSAPGAVTERFSEDGATAIERRKKIMAYEKALRRCASGSARKALLDELLRPGIDALLKQPLDRPIQHLTAEAIYPELRRAQGWFTLDEFIIDRAAANRPADVASALLTVAAVAVLLWRESRFLHGDLNARNIMMRRRSKELRFDVKLIDLGWSRCEVPSSDGRAPRVLESTRMADTFEHAWELSSALGNADAAKLQLRQSELRRQPAVTDARAVQMEIARLVAYMSFPTQKRQMDRERQSLKRRRGKSAAGMTFSEIREYQQDELGALLTEHFGAAYEGETDGLLCYRLKCDLLELVAPFADAVLEPPLASMTLYELLFQTHTPSGASLTELICDADWEALWCKHPTFTLEGLQRFAAGCGLDAAAWRRGVCETAMGRALRVHGLGAAERFEASAADKAKQ
jgi:hypothetical protein